MTLPTGLYRADHVGSFLRPSEVLQKRAAAAKSEITPAELRQVEDKYVADVASKQLAAGLRSITDGEFRRAYFHTDFLKHLDGVEVKGAIASEKTKDAFAPPRLLVTGKVGHSKSIQVEDFKYLESCIKDNGKASVATTKVCIPSPTMLHFRGGREAIDKTAYPELPAFFEDVARAYQEELDDLYKAGCRFVKLDDTNLAYLCDPKMREAAEKERNEDLTTLPRQYAQLINAAISKRPSDMTIGIHLCRG